MDVINSGWSVLDQEMGQFERAVTMTLAAFASEVCKASQFGATACVSNYEDVGEPDKAPL